MFTIVKFQLYVLDSLKYISKMDPSINRSAKAIISRNLITSWHNLLLTVCSYHVIYSFQSESSFYSCLNVKELLTRSKQEIWSLSDWNGTWTHNYLVRKQTLNHLAKLANLAKWLSVRLWTKWLWVWVPLQSLTIFNFLYLFSILYAKNRHYCLICITIITFFGMN